MLGTTNRCQYKQRERDKCWTVFHILNQTAYSRKSCAPCCPTKKGEPPPTRDVNRDSGTASVNQRWLRRLVRRQCRHGSSTITCSLDLDTVLSPSLTVT